MTRDFFDFESSERDARDERDACASSTKLLESLGEGLTRHGHPPLRADAIVRSFAARTPMLTFGERAELLGSVLEDHVAEIAAGGASAQRGASSASSAASSRAASQSAQPARSGGSSSGGAGRMQSAGSGSTQRSAGSGAGAPQRQPARRFDPSSIVRGLQQGFDYFQQGAQLFQQFMPQSAPPPAAAAQGNPYAQPQPSAAGPGLPPDPGAGAAPAGYDVAATQAAPPQAGDQLASLIQALRLGNIPALSPQPQPSAAAAAPAPAPPAVSAAPEPPRRLDATALLGLLFGNPQIQSALRSAAVLGPAAPRTVELASPGLGGAAPSSAALPLGAIVNAIRALAGESLAELNEATQPYEAALPEYLLGESGECLIDPTDSEQRAALATHYLRVSGEATRQARLAPVEHTRSGTRERAQELERDFDRAFNWSNM